MRLCVMAMHDLRYNSNVLDLAETLVRKGHDVDVYAPFDSVRQHAGRGFRCVFVDRSRGKVTAALTCLRQMVGHYDVFIGMNATGLLLSLAARGWQRYGVCAYYAVELEAPGHAVGFGRVASVLRARGLRHDDIIITTGPARARLLGEWFPQCGSPCVLPNSPLRGPAGVACPLRESLCRKGFFDAARGQIVLYQGVLIAETAIETILMASRLWRSNAWLVVVGFGRPDLVDLVRRRMSDSGGRVVYLEPMALRREEWLEYVKDASVGLVLYRHRGIYANNPNLVYATPNKLYDYMACGVPVVCSDNPSLCDVGQLGWGLAVDPDDPTAVADAVDACLEDRDAKADAARRVFSSLYDFTLHAAQVSRCIEERMKGRRSRR